uniref:Kelch domain-containing protein 10 n=1 Tax=Panagrellus redivivus TaxID=6233 RepID=A0A7E4VG95_PANRE
MDRCHCIAREELDPVIGHIGGAYRGCLVVAGGYESRNRIYHFRQPNFLYILPYSFSKAATVSPEVWIEYKVGGDVPLPTSASIGLIHEDYLYQFGGTHEDNPIYPTAINTTNRLYRLDLKNGMWEFLSPKTANERQPSPRTFSVAFGTSKGVYYWGGYGPRSKMFHKQQLFLTDPAASTVFENKGNNSYCWTNQLIMFDTETLSWNVVKQGGEVPEPRCGGASAHDVDRNLFFISGGRCKDVKYNDFYMLDLGSFVWTKFTLQVPRHIADMQWPSMTKCLTEDYFILSIYYEEPGVSTYLPRFERLRLDIDVDNKKVVATNIEHPVKPNCWSLRAFIDNAFVEYGGFTRGLDRSFNCSRMLVEVQAGPTHLTPLIARDSETTEEASVEASSAAFSSTSNVEVSPILETRMQWRDKMNNFYKRYNLIQEVRKTKPTYEGDTQRTMPDLSLQQIFDVFDVAP